MCNPFSLKGKTILVTGASSGIGRAIAIECSRSGATLVITGRDANRLNETMQQLEGNNHQSMVADFMKEEDLNNLINATPILDGLVHSAGILKILPFPFINRKEFTGIMETNVMVPAFISQQLVKSKKMNRDSSVVFISSISGVLIATAGNSMYSTSKGAVNGLVKGMAADLAPKKIRVNSIIAGMIETKIFEGSSITAEQFEEDKKHYPLKRYGKPEEVAWAAIYLLSDASAWVTGSSLLIDGGYTLL